MFSCLSLVKDLDTEKYVHLVSIFMQVIWLNLRSFSCGQPSGKPDDGENMGGGRNGGEREKAAERT